MEKDLKVIVWCITYNQKNYIKDALEGFVMQKTNFRFEVIVHDDKSTDGTTEIVLEYAKRYPNIIKPYIEEENQWSKGGLKRIIDIMNEKFRIAPYIAFCEGDDYWTSPNKLQKQVDFLEHNKEYSMCFHRAKIKYECDNIAWIGCENIQDRDYSPTEIFVNWTVATASVVCRKESMTYYSNLKKADDIYNYDIFIFLSCAMVGKLRGMSEMYSVYRIQSEGLTYNDSALLKCRMKNPDHFKCLKLNFPIVKSRYINRTISKTLFERALVMNCFVKSTRDYIASFICSPIQFFRCFAKTIKVQCTRHSKCRHTWKY